MWPKHLGAGDTKSRATNGLRTHYSTDKVVTVRSLIWLDFSQKKQILQDDAVKPQ